MIYVTVRDFFGLCADSCLLNVRFYDINKGATYEYEGSEYFPDELESCLIDTFDAPVNDMICLNISEFNGVNLDDISGMVRVD